MCLIIRKPSIFTRLRFWLQKYPITKKLRTVYCIRLHINELGSSYKKRFVSPFNPNFLWKKKKLYTTYPTTCDKWTKFSYIILGPNFFHVFETLKDANRLLTQIQYYPRLILNLNDWIARTNKSIEVIIVKATIPAGSMYIKGECQTGGIAFKSGICTNQLIINNFTPIHSITI